MGKVFYYCGAAGQGLQAKLTQNLILANIMEAFAEGMVLATKGGIAPSLMLEILDNSAAKSGLSPSKHRTSCLGTSARTSPPSGCIRMCRGAGGRQGTRSTAPRNRLDAANVTGKYVFRRADEDFCSMIGFWKTGGYTGEEVMGHMSNRNMVVRNTWRRGKNVLRFFYKKLLLFEPGYPNIGIKPGRPNSTKARLTS